MIRVRRRAGPAWIGRFLEAFRNRGNVRAACEAAGVSRSTPYLRGEAFGAKQRAPFVLYGLLHCHCGHILTGSHYKNLAYTAYKCHLARTVPGHGLGAVPEKRLLPWVMAEAGRLRAPSVVELEVQHEVQRAALAVRRERIAEALDWSWPPETINEVLRALWSEVRLDERMAPLEAVWRVPEWRAPDAQASPETGHEAGDQP